jgi:hypothetical protein
MMRVDKRLRTERSLMELAGRESKADVIGTRMPTRQVGTIKLTWRERQEQTGGQPHCNGGPPGLACVTGYME